MQLSIIICVYNTAINYLAECLKSITESTLQEIKNEYEICMVDDGSSVDYSNLVERYNIRYIKTENRGIYSARKTGIEMARGKYSIFCDSDDTVSFNYHLPMLRKAESTGADIVINDWAFHTAKARYYCKNDETIKYDLDISGEEKLFAFFKNCGRQHSFYVLWNKLYNTQLLRKAFELLEQNNYPLDSSYSEDVAINFFAWRDANRIINIHTGYYFYRIHSTQSVNAGSEEKIAKQIKNMATTFSIMRNHLEKNIYADKISDYIKSWQRLMARAHYSAAQILGYEKLYPLIKESYGVNELSKSTLKDSDGYIGTKILGSNFTEVDDILFSIWKSDIPVSVNYKKSDRYTSKTVAYLEKNEKVKKEKKRQADIIIPPLKSSLRMRFIHNGWVYKIGLILFKKGSKVREFLKKFI